jgi:nucleotide-binding universal stress UspA family protein
MFKKILLATDGSEGALKAARAAAEIAGKFGATVTVLSVGQIPVINLFNYYPSMIEPEVLPENIEKRIIEHAQTAIKETSRLLEEAGVPFDTRFELGHPADTICDISASEKYNLIVMGSRGLSGLKGLLVGSVSNRVVHQCHCPIIIVK